MNRSKKTESELAQEMLSSMKKVRVEGQFETHGEPLSMFWQHIRALKNMHRLSGLFTIQKYDTATHCYYTGILFEEIAAMEKMEVTAYEIQFVYRHDVFESVTGDLLLPAKTHSKKVSLCWNEIESLIVNERYGYLRSWTDGEAAKRFSSQAWRLFKACDLLELLLFCYEEIRLGNGTLGIARVIRNCRLLIESYRFQSIDNWLRHMS